MSFIFILVSCSPCFSFKDVPHNVSSGPNTSHSHNSPENYAMNEGVVQVGPYTGTTLSICIEPEYNLPLSFSQIQTMTRHATVTNVCAYIRLHTDSQFAQRQW